MKVYATVADTNLLNGYLNIDALPINGKTQANLADLSNLLDQGEVHEFISPNSLDYFSLADKEKVLAGWVGLLAHGGSIVIGGTDLDEAARQVYKGVGTQTANEIFYSPSNIPPKKALLTINDVVQILSSMGLRIVSKRIEGIQYFVRGERP